MNYFLYALKNSFNIKGRARRAEFGWFTLICMLISFSLMLIGGFADGLGFSKLASALEIINSLFSLLIFPASITIAIRRLHDLGKSGWWYVAYTVIVVVVIAFILASLISAVIVHQMNEDEIIEFLLSGNILIPLGLLLIFVYGVLLFLIFKDGQRFTNAYGEDPKAPITEKVEPVLNNVSNAQDGTEQSKIGHQEF
ncbi:DUF805 domain-containing protein [Haemophilus sputorum]|uniref:DUF805 domain-containing protein n=1 Tax=Haemophilus sputorum TaxID=1078480 RepID=UPI002104B069|nr:DUF805 domain-containing protein [Haemophilus sputorum]MCQ1857991.1 DUF805 domain-containing protein [Haemophilus sputorum]